jgi:hypothetical protein
VLRNLALNLHKDSLSLASNNMMSINFVLEKFKEEEIDQLLVKESMDIEEHNYVPSNVVQKKAINQHVFH